MDGGRRAREARAAVAISLVVLAALVAVTSQSTTGEAGGVIKTGSGELHAAGTALLTVGFVVWIAVTAVLVSALWPAGLRRRKRNPEDERFEPYRPDVYWWEKAIVLALPALVFAGLIAAVILVGDHGGPASHSTSVSSTLTTAAPTTLSPAANPAHGPSGTSRSGITFALVAAAAILATAAAALVVIRRRSRPSSGTPGRRTQPAVAAALEWSLDDLRREPDPRRAVIAAYARMERLLGDHGVRRHAWEAPLEYLNRVLGRVTVSDRAAEQLTGLFQEAKFSPHAVGEPERARAVEILTSMRRELDAK
jgi:hypothetical protein